MSSAYSPALNTLSLATASGRAFTEISQHVHTAERLARLPVLTVGNSRGKSTQTHGLVWSKYTNGLKWRALGFSPSSLFEWTSPIQKPRLQSYLLRGLRLRGNPRCSGRGCSPRTLVAKRISSGGESDSERPDPRSRVGCSFPKEKRRRWPRSVSACRRALEDVAATAKPDTILGWYRNFAANKSDGSKFRRSVGRQD